MKNFKNTAIILAAMGFLASTAHAEVVNTEPMLISANSNSISINGAVLEGAFATVYNDKTMLPLRAICENLGFEVIWNDESRKIELKNLPVYITLKPGEDAYTFAKTAPMTLGAAPVIINNQTYVPLGFIDEILGGEYSTEGGISITYAAEGELDESPYATVYIKEITDEGLLIEDFERGEIRLTVSDETVIKDADGNDITASELSVGDEISVKYSEVMTMSLPALTAAEEITKTGDIAKTVLEGKITEVTADDESGKLSQITIELDGQEAVLNVDENTTMKDSAGSPVVIDDSFVGKTVRARTTGISTRSIPAQYPTTDIIVF